MVVPLSKKTTFKGARLVQSDFSNSAWSESDAKDADVSYCDFYRSDAIEILSRVQKQTIGTDAENRRSLDEKILSMNLARMQP